MSRIYDNIELKFEQGLNDIITAPEVKRVDFCVGYFNLRGWNLVVEQVDNLPGDNVFENDEQFFRTCRLLVGMNQPDEELVRYLYSDNHELPDSETIIRCKLRMANEFRKQLLAGLPTKKDESTLRHLSSQLKSGKVCVKLYLREPLHAKLYLAYRPADRYHPIYSIMGSSNLTYAGLTRQGELNAEFGDSSDSEKFAAWFDDRWNDRYCMDISSDLAGIIDASWAGAELPPYYIYLKTAYHLSQDARMGIQEFVIPPEFRKKMFEFQQVAVKIAARHLNSEKSNGAMIGDVVGLGKTITACAIAKIYENTFSRGTLIICPANLQTMWQGYRNEYDLKADIMSMSKPIDIENARAYGLVVIDESHNLRNSEGKRYQNIKRLIQHLDAKVLLLTATPYNKDYTDISNQLRLFIPEDRDLGIRPEVYISSIGGDRQFQLKHSEIDIRSIRAFEKSGYVEDWSELMRMFLVRRTRSFIKANYATMDKERNRMYLVYPESKERAYFPDRVPKSIKFNTHPGDQYSRLYSKQMIDLMSELKLPRYGLSKYVDESKTANTIGKEKQLLDNLSKAGARMMGFCKSTFFKRIDSSGFSFLLTLYRHLLRNALYIYAIDNHLPLPVGDENQLSDDFLEDEDMNRIVFGTDPDKYEEMENKDRIAIPTDMKHYSDGAKKRYEFLKQKNNVDWIDSKYFKRTLKQNLNKDCRTILDMIKLCGDWIPKSDQKLNKLQEMLETSFPYEKVLVFTQYSDTARYIAGQLKNRRVESVDCATGDNEDPTAIAHRFSPVSNGINMTMDSQTRILIATDVLSEGQNLQDAHIIINYDLPWAIIRLIQRAGRVDRIGQKADTILCYSFFPADGVEDIIKLRDRLNRRINENAGIVGSDEEFFEGNAKNLTDIYNEKSGILDDDDEDVDLASMAYQIWKKAITSEPSLKTIIPNLSNVVYSTKKASDASINGVITYAKTYNDCDVLTWYGSDGEIITQSQKKILQAMECKPKEPVIEPLNNHFDLVKKAVEGMRTSNTTIGGMLGSRFSTRYRLIALLEDYYSQPLSIFFNQETKDMLKFAIDDIYNNPLQENAKLTFGRMLRGYSREEIVDYVLEMRKAGSLCRMDPDKNKSKEPSIICSMGIRN